jgi:hypothetical protein
MPSRIVKPKKKEPVKVAISVTIKPSTLQAVRKIAKSSNMSISEVMGNFLDFAIQFDKSLQSTDFSKDLDSFLEPFIAGAIRSRQERETVKQETLFR